MAIPRVEVQVTADTRQAEAGLQRVERGLQDVQNRAPMAQQSTARFGGALASMGNISGRTRGQIQNFSFQLQDMAVQLQAGTRASTVMAQQLPQMVGGFGAAGAAVGALIALGIPLASFLLSSANSGRNLAQIMDALAEAVENADSQFNGLSDSLSGLVAIGGQYSARAMEIAQAQREIAFHDAAAALNDTIDAVSDMGSLQRFSALLRLIEEGQQNLAAGNAPQSLTRLVENYQTQLENLAADMGMSVQGAEVLADALDALAAAQGPAAQAQAAQNAAEAFLAAAGSVDQMTESERQIYAQLLQTEQAALRLQAIEQQRSAFVADQQAELTRSANLYRTIIQYGEDSAEADRLRAQYARQEYEARLQSEGVTGQNLQTLMALYDQQVRLSDEAERTQDAVERIAGADFNSFADRVRALAQELGIAASEAERLLDALPVGMTYGRTLSSGSGSLLPPATGETGTGGGGGGSAFGGRIAALVESLQTERETIDAWYQESLTLLEQANAAELEAIGGHNEARLRLEEEYQNRLAAIREAGHGNALSSILQSGQQIAAAIGQTNERAMRVAQAFGAAEALVNAYRAASQALADPTLPWFAKVSAAASVLAAGIGFANSIRSINASGGGGAAATASAANANAAPRQNIVIDLVGETFGRNSVTALFEQINEGLRNGERIEGILVR